MVRGIRVPYMTCSCSRSDIEKLLSKRPSRFGSGKTKPPRTLKAMNPFVHLSAVAVLAAALLAPACAADAFSPPLTPRSTGRVHYAAAAAAAAAAARTRSMRTSPFRHEPGTISDEGGDPSASFCRNFSTETITSLRGGTVTPTTSLFASLSGLAGWIGKSTTRCWTMLMVSITLEICATTLTKVASNTRDPRKLVASMSLYIASLLGFATCLPKIEVGVAYAVWSALGTAIVSTFGIIFFGERCDVAKIASIALILIGVLGLNLTDGGGH